MTLDTRTAAKQGAPSYARATWLQAPLALRCSASLAEWHDDCRRSGLRLDIAAGPSFW